MSESTIKKENAIDEKKIAPIDSQPTIETAKEIKKNFKELFATGYTPVYINSLEKEVGFKEITVQQQKTLSRTMIGNENRKDIIYDAQCALINEAALMDGFDIYKYTELERLKLLIALYQANMFNNDVQFTCKQCGKDNKYKLNFDNVLMKLDKLDIVPKTFHYEKPAMNFDFTVEYPNVKLVSSFHKQYFAKHKNMTKKDVEVNDTMSNMEYINLFISGLRVSDKNGNVLKEASFKGFKPEDIEEILQCLPQDVLYTENGVLQYVTIEFLQKLNESFDKHQCIYCETIQEDERSNQAESFL